MAIDIADHIGSSRMHGINEQEIPLAVRIAVDPQRVLTEISTLDLSQLTSIELSEIEDLLLKWWLTGKAGTDDAGEYLAPTQKVSEI